MVNDVHPVFVHVHMCVFSRQTYTHIPVHPSVQVVVRVHPYKHESIHVRTRTYVSHVHVRSTTVESLSSGREVFRHTLPLVSRLQTIKTLIRL